MAERKLIVAMKPMGDGKVTPVLCYEDGEPLPGQCAVKVQTAVDEIATVTVTFCMFEFA